MDVVALLAFAALGLVAGRIARAVVPWPGPLDIVGTTALGLAGSLLGGALGVLLLREDLPYQFFALDTWVAAILGSIAIIAAYQALRRAR